MRTPSINAKKNVVEKIVNYESYAYLYTEIDVKTSEIKCHTYKLLKPEERHTFSPVPPPDLKWKVTYYNNSAYREWIDEERGVRCSDCVVGFISVDQPYRYVLLH